MQFKPEGENLHVAVVAKLRKESLETKNVGGRKLTELR